MVNFLKHPHYFRPFLIYVGANVMSILSLPINVFPLNFDIFVFFFPNKLNDIVNEF